MLCMSNDFRNIVRRLAPGARAMAFGALTLCAVSDAPARALEPITRELANGISLVLYPAEQLRERVIRGGAGSEIRLEGARRIAVIDDINDPAIYNKGDGEFHPFPQDAVIEALAAVRHPSLATSVTVYLLPYPRRELVVSSTVGSEVFLSPHVLKIDPAVAAHIATHELGHVFHNRHLSRDAIRWGIYRDIRDIEDTSRFSDAASHPYRPREIFAEDFRVLFGGADATWTGVANPELSPPQSVAGLEAFMMSLTTTAPGSAGGIVASSYPNPFNPATTIRVEIPGTAVGVERVSVRVYDVRGKLVTELYSGPASSSSLEVRWNGTDRQGNRVASAPYYALIRVGRAHRGLTLVVLK